MFQSRLAKTYVCVEVILLVALIALQIVTMSQGLSIMNKSAPLWNYIGATKVSLTSISFLFVFWTFLRHRREGLSALDLMVVYFALTVTADVFFSFSPVNWPAHLCFLLSYCLFMFARRGKWYEALIALLLGTAAFLVLHFAAKMDLLMALLDSFLSALLVNCVALFLRYAKTGEREWLVFAIGVTLVLISDLTIVGMAKIASPLALHNAIAMANWPFYVAGNVTLVCHYAQLKKRPERE